jgi:hypothetical protein
MQAAATALRYFLLQVPALRHVDTAMPLLVRPLRAQHGASLCAPRQEARLSHFLSKVAEHSSPRFVIHLSLELMLIL